MMNQNPFWTDGSIKANLTTPQWIIDKKTTR